MSLSSADFFFQKDISRISCADPESFARGCPTPTTFFFSETEGMRIKIPVKVAHDRPASETPIWPNIETWLGFSEILDQNC